MVDAPYFPAKLVGMEKIQNMVAVLPTGKFFDQICAEVIQPWSARLGASVARPNLAGTTLGAICSAVEGTDLLLADVSGRNAAAMYAAGYAQGIGKKVLFIAQLESDFPFAPGNQRLIIYSGSIERLREALDALASKDGKPPSDGGPREKFFDLFGEILQQHGHEHKGGIEMENPQTFVLLDQDMDLALVQALSRRARELGVRLKLM